MEKQISSCLALWGGCWLSVIMNRSYKGDHCAGRVVYLYLGGGYTNLHMTCGIELYVHIVPI